MPDVQVDLTSDNLVLHLENERPIAVADLARVFDSLSKDYRRINPGHQLVITQVSQGSFWAVFKDALEIVAGINAVVKFGKTLAAAYKALQAEDSTASKVTGQTTIESLAKIAANSNSLVELGYRGRDGEQLFVRATPPEFQGVQRELNRRKSLSGRKGRRSPSRKIDIMANTLSRGVLPAEYDRLADLHGRPRELERSVKVVVDFLNQNGMRALLPVLAQELETAGNLEAARLIREIGGVPPPK
jgi:hypothetical protein